VRYGGFNMRKVCAVLLLITAIAFAQAQQMNAENDSTNMIGDLRELERMILIPGNPPYSYGSIISFARLMESAFGISMTETELQVIASHFIVNYNSAGMEAKKKLATEWQQLESQLRGAPANQTAQLKARIKQRISDEAIAGHEWAGVVQEIMQKRERILKKASGKPVKNPDGSQLDNQLSEADLDAAVEMLYFMWIAAGRSAEVVTLQDLMSIREATLREFNQYSPDFQYVLTNAEDVYSGLRSQWYSAGWDQKAVLMQQFSANLDDLGFYDPATQQGSRGGDAWSDVSPDDMSSIRAQALQNAAFNAGNTWPTSP